MGRSTRTAALFGACLLLGPNAGAGEGRAARQAGTAGPRLTLERLVNPSTRVEIDGRTVRFALHGLIRFDTLDELFAHIDGEAGRWTFGSDAERQRFAEGLMQRGVESRIVSMETELPLEVVLTHTGDEVERAIGVLRTAHTPLIFKGRHWRLDPQAYASAFLRVRDRWSASLNCWSASPSIPGRVLSNWYIIDEGIRLFGGAYDSTEHFWQAVKYHPDVTVGDLQRLLSIIRAADWRPWLEGLRADQAFYWQHAYAVEFLFETLTPERLGWLDAELARVADAREGARRAQQRVVRDTAAPPRYTSLTEKVLWGDLADVFHLISVFGTAGRSAEDPARTAARRALAEHRFDAVYLDGYGGGRFGFLSQQFQALMLEIWKVKFLQIERFREVIRSTAGRRLDHFLNDGDSPDIPIPVYVDYLNRIRDMALEGR